ncbi:MAG TPA: hypothetical protein VLB84_13665, partial [Bacteroidia bacterium]|nr:hypothetical protein [Bacteroidia bacterium]
MKNTFKGTKSLIFLTVLILSSCATPSKVACPSFDSDKVLKNKKYKSGTSHFNVFKAFTLKNGHKSKRKKLFNPNFIDDQFAYLDAEEFDLLASSEEVKLHDLLHSNFKTIEQNHHQEYKVENSKKLNLNKQRKAINTTSYPHLKLIFEKKDTLIKNQDTINHQKSKR